MSDNPPATSQPPRRRSRWLRRLATGALVLTVVTGWWLNGPGLRMLAPRVASHFAGKAGVEVAFELDGTLIGGLRFHDVEVAMADGPLRLLTIDELVPKYEFMRLIRGEILGVTASGIHVEVELTGNKDEASEPFDFAKLNEMLRNAQSTVADLDLDVSGVTAVIDRADQPRVALGPTSIRHVAGEDVIDLDLGEITRGDDMLTEAQSVRIDWSDERLALAPLTLHPALTVDSLALAYPADGGLFAEGEVDFAGAGFNLTSDPLQGTLSLQLREGELAAERVGESFGIDLPASGTVTSLTLDMANFSPDPKSATGNLVLLVENARWQEVAVDELNLEVILNADTARAVARAAAGDTEVRMDATSTLDRESMSLGVSSGTLEVPSVAATVDALGGLFAMPEGAGPIPAAAIKADFQVTWEDGFSPASATVDLGLSPDDTELATGMKLDAEWSADAPLAATLVADGLKATAELDLEKNRYTGEVAMQGFDTGRFTAWLDAAAITLPGRATVDASWSGNGPLAAGAHQGEMRMASAVWAQPDQPDIAAEGRISYALPGRVALHNLKVTRDGQVINANLTLADGSLEIAELRWTDADGTEMAEARGSLPVPEDFAAWREFIADDTRPLDLTVRTRTLGFDKLAAWVPALAAVDARATAMLEIGLSGNFASPVLDATLEVIGVRAVGQPDLPPADVVLKVNGRDRVLTLDGSVDTPDFAPVVLTAKLPFAPAAWAEDIDSLTGAEFEASADLPRIDLAQFAGMVPAARRLAGIVTGYLRATGKINNPRITGRLELADGMLDLEKGTFPDITGITATAEFDLERAKLTAMRATIAGGTLSAAGTFVIAERELDLRLRGESLPLVRNEDLIMRANADLRAAGPLDAATISGSVSLVDSLFFRDIELLPIGKPFTGPQAAELPEIDTAPPTDAVPELLENWPLDLRFTTTDPMLIRGNLATGRVLADVRIRGTLGTPRPDGQIRLLRGRAVLPFSTLSVPEAVLTFTPANGFDPIIEARGTAEPRPYTVNLFAYGRLSDPQIVLSSIPPLPRNEIMTLLATGTTTSGLEDPQMASARAMQLFAEEIRRGRVPFGNQIRPILGLLDRVDFTLGEGDPYSSDTFTTATLKLHDRWYLTAGMGEEGNTRMFAVWRLRFR